MQIKAILFYSLIIAALCVLGCTQPAGPEAGGSPDQDLAKRVVQPPYDAHPPSPTMAIIHVNHAYLDDPDEVAKFAQADLLFLGATEVYDPPRNANGVAALKAANPDIKVLVYTLTHSSLLKWEDAAPVPGQPARYPYDWFIETKPYWSYTTTGDTMMAWPGQVLLNILDPDCRAAMIGVIAKHHAISSNRVSGVFWDHFSQRLWVPQNQEGVEGELDLDGDGIPHQDDDDEIAAYQAAAAQMVMELRAFVGEDFIQMVNGGLARKDSTFAALVDGMMYERFPKYTFPGSSEWAGSLDPSVSNNLFAARNWPRARNGGPWLLLTNRDPFTFVDNTGALIRYPQAEFCRVVALLTDAVVSYHPSSGLYLYGWPEVELDLGLPLGGVDRDGDVLSRAFERGAVTVTLTDNNDIPMSFEILQEGRVVQSFAYPAHFP